MLLFKTRLKLCVRSAIQPLIEDNLFNANSNNHKEFFMNSHKLFIFAFALQKNGMENIK